MKLMLNALTKYLAGVVLVGLLLFPAAGTIFYPNGWRLMAHLFLPMAVVGIILFCKAPELLKKRLNGREKQPEQKRVVALSAFLFVAAFLAAGLDFRFGWTTVPHFLVVASSGLLLVSYGLYAEVMRENAYLSRTVEVQAGQKVIDTGLYGVVRHPMYGAVTILFLSMPLVLGSAAALIPFLFLPAVLIKRIKNEEQVLEEGLAGYREYTQRVRWRMVPFLW